MGSCISCKKGKRICPLITTINTHNQRSSWSPCSSYLNDSMTKSIQQVSTVDISRKGNCENDKTRASRQTNQPFSYTPWFSICKSPDHILPHKFHGRTDDLSYEELSLILTSIFGWYQSLRTTLYMYMLQKCIDSSLFPSWILIL